MQQFKLLQQKVFIECAEEKSLIDLELIDHFKVDTQTINFESAWVYGKKLECFQWLPLSA